jgi:hypothetical protein
LLFSAIRISIGCVVRVPACKLQEAFDEYVHRYKRLPPKGFDKWWEFCVKNDVKIRDDYND